MAPRNDRHRQHSQGAPLERLRTLGDPALRQRANEVTVFDARLEKLANTMLEVMHREEGVGLAAPQIGVLSRVMVWRHPDREDEEHVFVNPKIIAQSESCTTAGEGCLSVPGCTVEVVRADEVTVAAWDVYGAPVELAASGMVARIMQHEIDHLDGRLILDRASAEERRRALKELREQALATDT